MHADCTHGPHITHVMRLSAATHDHIRCTVRKPHWADDAERGGTQQTNITACHFTLSLDSTYILYDMASATLYGIVLASSCHNQYICICYYYYYRVLLYGNPPNISDCSEWKMACYNATCSGSDFYAWIIENYHNFISIMSVPKPFFYVFVIRHVLDQPASTTPRYISWVRRLPPQRIECCMRIANDWLISISTHNICGCVHICTCLHVFAQRTPGGDYGANRARRATLGIFRQSIKRFATT